MIGVIFGIIFIFLSQKQITREFGRFVHKLGGDHKAFINFWSAIFLPGTILHEVSHFLVAAMCGVRTGRVEVLPEFIEEVVVNKEPKPVHLGYVQVSKMNPIQGFLVGTAPFITGLAMLVWLSSIIPNALQTQQYGILGLEVYIFFTVANSFFPSWQDMKHTLSLIVISVLIIATGWYFGFNLVISPSSKVLEVINILSKTLFASALLNCIILIPFFIVNRVGFKFKS